MTAYEHASEMQGPLEDALARLAAAQLIRPPNLDIAGYTLPDRAILRSFIDRLERSSPDILVYEATSIREAIPLPVLGSDSASHEHLVIYEEIADLRASLQNLADRAIVNGYRPLASLSIQRSEVGPQLARLAGAVDQLASDLQRLRSSDFGGITFNAGPFGVDLRTLDSVAARLLRLLRKDSDAVDAVALWSTSEELTHLSRRIFIYLETQRWSMSDDIANTLANIRTFIEEIAAAARDILEAAVLRHRTAVEQTTKSKPSSKRPPRFEFAVDIGTATTRVYVRGRGIVFSEPSVGVIRRARRGETLFAVGAEAAPMIGKTPNNLKPFSFLDGGGLVHERYVEMALRHLLRNAGVGGALNTGRALIAVQGSGTETHRKAIQSVLAGAGLRRTTPIDRTLAAALGAQLDVSGADWLLVADIGAGSSDIAIYGSGRRLGGKTVAVGGVTMDRALTQLMRSEYNLVAHLGTVQAVKHMACSSPQEARFDIIGRDLAIGVPRAISLSSRDIERALLAPAEVIARSVRDLVEASDDATRRGLKRAVLTGAAALVPSVANCIAAMTELEVVVAPTPESCTIMGCARFVDDGGLAAEWSLRSPDLA